MFSWLQSALKRVLQPLAAPARWIGLASLWNGWSLPFRTALSLFVFLVICVLVNVLYAYWYSPLLFEDLRKPWILLTIAVFVIAFPTAVYFWVKTWLEVEPTQYPEIDEAWQRGWQSVLKKGIDPLQSPLVLAYGVASAVDADRLMATAHWDLLVSGEPEGKFPLRWYARKDAIIVFLLDASSTSLAQQRDRATEVRGPTAAGDFRGTIVNPAGQTNPHEGAPAARGIRDTIVASPSQAPSPPTKPAGPTGTILIPAGGLGAAKDEPSAAVVPYVPTKAELVEQAHRLERVCLLAKAARQPVCPINGTLAILDWKALAADKDILRSTFASDAEIILNAAQIHAPLAVLISGMESEDGFIEFARRMGEEQTKNNRIGQKFDHLAVPSLESLERLGSAASGVLESWIYDLFRKPECLDRSEKNAQLFSLLCKLRTTIQPKLRNILAALSGVPKSSEQRGPLLCGCYFGAAGSNRREQAFVGAVFDKLLEFEEELDWTDTAWAQENRYRGWINTIMFANMILFLWIVGILIYYYWFSHSSG